MIEVDLVEALRRGVALGDELEAATAWRRSRRAARTSVSTSPARVMTVTGVAASASRCARPHRAAARSSAMTVLASRPSTPSGAVTTPDAATYAVAGDAAAVTARSGSGHDDLDPAELLGDRVLDGASSAASTVVGEHGVGERAERRGDGGLEAGLHLHVLGDEAADAGEPAATRALEPSFWSRAEREGAGAGREGVAFAFAAVQLVAERSISASASNSARLGELVGLVEVGLAAVGRSRPRPRAAANSARAALATLARGLERVLLAQHLAAHGGEPGGRGVRLAGELRDLEVVPRDEGALRGDLLVEGVERWRARRPSRAGPAASAASARGDDLAAAARPRRAASATICGRDAWAGIRRRRPRWPSSASRWLARVYRPRRRSCTDSRPKAVRRATSTASPTCACSMRCDAQLLLLELLLQHDALGLPLAARCGCGRRARRAASTTSSASRRARASRTIAAIDWASRAISAWRPSGFSWRRISPARSLRAG